MSVVKAEAVIIFDVAFRRRALVNGTSTAPNGTVGMPPRAGRHRIDPPAAAAKRSTLRPLVIYIYARKRFLQSLALGPPPVPQSPDRRCLVRRSGTESSQTRRWRRQSRANPSLKQAHVGGQLTRGARGYKNKLGNNPMRRPTEGNVRVAQERAMDV